jgi:acyl-CoA reductase-like NAD-dependent aldehyde dehydrogenase
MTSQRLTKVYAGGAWVDSSARSTIPVINPATEVPIAEVTEGSAQDVRLAVAAAREALRSWSATPPAERGKYVARIGEALRGRAAELAATISAELGVPRHQAAGFQVSYPLSKFAAYEELAGTFRWEERAGAATLLRVPVGVVAAITPWNFPISQAVDKIAAAMLAGCTVILKPSEVTPVSALAFAEAAAEAGVPAGVFNLVNGSGLTAGDALVHHPDVDMITFTGSTRTGKRIAAVAAERVARVSLELGGKSATILLDDADLDEAIPAAVKACFLNSGQVCTALTRLLAPRKAMDEVITRVKEAAEAYTVGDPGTQVDLGPLVSAAQRDKVRAYIERGIAEGARLVTGGPGAPDGLARGYYVKPTVFADVVSSMTIAQEEIFGPVLSILAYHDDNDAVRIANDTPYGLSGAVWSKDTARAGGLARRLRTGMVKVNGAGAAGIPFGGFKQSGIGREQGRFGLEEFLEWQAITNSPSSP